MTAFDIDPGAQVLWCLRRRASDVRCVLYSSSVPVQVHIIQDRDVVLKESFATGAAAEWWAQEYGRRLLQHGWSAHPEGCSPSSAA